MSNKLENLDLREIETTIEFCKNRFGTSDYINFCELFMDGCDSCPIGKQIKNNEDCEYIYLYTKYKNLITEELVKDIKEKEWNYCGMNCETCKLQDVWIDKNDCNIFIDMIIDYFEIENEEEIQDKIDEERLEAKIKTIEKKLDLILELLIKN